jgi:hypothetical protein
VHDPEKWGTGFRKRSCANKEPKQQESRLESWVSGV